MQKFLFRVYERSHLHKTSTKCDRIVDKTSTTSDRIYTKPALNVRS
ncbi:hypothetical protein [Brasilonema sp. UFV-L1]